MRYLYRGFCLTIGAEGVFETVYTYDTFYQCLWYTVYRIIRLQVCGSKRLGSHAGCQEVGRCRTGSESEESIVGTQESMQVRDPPLL